MSSLKDNRFSRRAAAREKALDHAAVDESAPLTIDVRGRVEYEDERAVSVMVADSRYAFDDDGGVVIQQRRFIFDAAAEVLRAI